MHNKVKEHFISTVKTAGAEYDYLLRHLLQVEKWAKKLLKMYPQANEEIVLSGVWSHDIGQVVGNKEIDHAVNSEVEIKLFLKELNIDEGVINQVAHCARSHRCKDIQPNTIEAKILATADSSSHMTDIVYIDMFNRGDYDAALGKLERDFRDVGLFPELQSDMKPLYEAWKKLLEVYPRN
jgi:hypothetical protein